MSELYAVGGTWRDSPFKKQGFESHERPAHLALSDLANKRCRDEIDLEPHRLDALFKVHCTELGGAAKMGLAEPEELRQMQEPVL